MVLNLGEFEQLVLLALLRLKDDAYGVTIRREIETRTGRVTGLGSVYKTLERLEHKGIVSSRVGDPTPERGGRRKRYYHVSPLGVRALRYALRAVEQMANGLESF